MAENILVMESLITAALAFLVSGIVSNGDAKFMPHAAEFLFF